VKMDESDVKIGEAAAQAGEATSTQPLTVRLHPEADAILAVQGEATSGVRKEFTVSSAILSVASDYFRTLLRSNFKEGIETRRGDCPTISMNEDDPQAMETILSVLHYQNLGAHESLSIKTLAVIAMQSDKYDCTAALRPWFYLWFRDAGKVSDKDDLLYLLVGAYFINAPKHFADISARIVRNVTADFNSVWAKHDMTNLLPHYIRGAVSRKSQYRGR